MLLFDDELIASRTMPIAEPMVRVLGGPWEFEACEIRCSGGQVMRAMGRGNASLEGCSLGGRGPLGLRCWDVVIAKGASSLTLDGCSVEASASFAGRVEGDSKLVFSRTDVRNAGCGFDMCDNTNLTVVNCVLTNLAVGAFRVSELFLRSTRLVVINTTLQGTPPWMFPSRPRRTLWRNVTLEDFAPRYPEKFDATLCRKPRPKVEAFEGANGVEFSVSEDENGYTEGWVEHAKQDAERAERERKLNITSNERDEPLITPPGAKEMLGMFFSVTDPVNIAINNATGGG
ncbi:hypothetical protein T484DRAFT_1890052, partial [Baffinella frigidus]